jgi:hypothetical protein
MIMEIVEIGFVSSTKLERIHYYVYLVVVDCWVDDCCVCDADETKTLLLCIERTAPKKRLMRSTTLMNGEDEQHQ